MLTSKPALLGRYLWLAAHAKGASNPQQFSTNAWWPRINRSRQIRHFLKVSMTALRNTPTRYVGLGRILESQGKVEEAAQLYRDCIAAAPNTPSGYVGLGRILES